jgi:hypothetical protein
MKLFKSTHKQIIEGWDEYLDNIRCNTSVNAGLLGLGYADREKRHAELEAHPEAWMKEMFGEYAKYPFATFQKRLSNASYNIRLAKVSASSTQKECFNNPYFLVF